MRTFSILFLSVVLVLSYNEHVHKSRVLAQGQNDYYNRTLPWQAGQNPMNCQEHESYDSCIGKLQDRIATLETKLNELEKGKQVQNYPPQKETPNLHFMITPAQARDKK